MQNILIFQLDYYTLSSPTHWITHPDIITTEHVTLKGLSPSSTLFVTVRALNDHGLSPPSPMSKAMKTLATTSNGLEATGDVETVRERLAQRVIDLKEALVLGSRKVKLRWEVSLIQGQLIVYKYKCSSLSLND